MNEVADSDYGLVLCGEVVGSQGYYHLQSTISPCGSLGVEVGTRLGQPARDSGQLGQTKATT